MHPLILIMKRLLFAAAILLISFPAIQAQEIKKVESNLMINSGTFFETGSYAGNLDWFELLSSADSFRPTYLLLPGHVSRLSYGLDIRMSGRWSLMPGAGLRVQTASLLGMFAIGGDVDMMAAADAFCVLRYHIPVGEDQIIIGLGPDVSFLSKNTYYIDADPNDPRNGKPKFYRFDYGIQPSVTFRTGKHWQWGLEANFGLRNMRIPYELSYIPSWQPDAEPAQVSVKGSTYLHTISLTCGFNF